MGFWSDSFSKSKGCGLSNEFLQRQWFKPWVAKPLCKLEVGKTHVSTISLLEFQESHHSETLPQTKTGLTADPSKRKLRVTTQRWETERRVGSTC